jgi:hypothetical protein
MYTVIKWVKDEWVVYFGKKQNLELHTKNYQKAFFWIKWSKHIQKDFVLDYIHNR